MYKKGRVPTPIGDDLRGRTNLSAHALRAMPARNDVDGFNNGLELVLTRNKL